MHFFPRASLSPLLEALNPQYTHPLWSWSYRPFSDGLERYKTNHLSDTLRFMHQSYPKFHLGSFLCIPILNHLFELGSDDACLFLCLPSFRRFRNRLQDFHMSSFWTCGPGEASHDRLNLSQFLIQCLILLWNWSIFSARPVITAFFHLAPTSQKLPQTIFGDFTEG